MADLLTRLIGPPDRRQVSFDTGTAVSPTMPTGGDDSDLVYVTATWPNGDISPSVSAGWTEIVTADLVGFPQPMRGGAWFGPRSDPLVLTFAVASDGVSFVAFSLPALDPQHDGDDTPTAGPVTHGPGWDPARTYIFTVFGTQPTAEITRSPPPLITSGTNNSTQFLTVGFNDDDGFTDPIVIESTDLSTAVKAWARFDFIWGHRRWWAGVGGWA